MVWFVRALVVCAFALVGPIILRPNNESLVRNVIIGLMTGLFMIWLSSLVGRVSKKFRSKWPIGVKRAGIVLYGLGIAIAVLCIGLAAYGAYQGMPGEYIAAMASFTIIYWAAGWGLHRSLT